jgi:hypothetical protein
MPDKLDEIQTRAKLKVLEIELNAVEFARKEAVRLRDKRKTIREAENIMTTDRPFGKIWHEDDQLDEVD